MLDHLRHRVADLIRPKPAAGGTAPPAAAGGGGDIDEAFTRRLREIVLSSGSALAGRINLLGLSRIKEHFGPSWERIAERAERIARNAIERRLTARDMYSKWDEFDFVLIFTDLPPAAAQLKCTLLAEEIARDLIGEEGAELIVVKTAFVRLDGAVDFENVPVRAALLGLLQRAETPAPLPMPADPLAGLAFRYRPMWDPVRRNAVLFRSVPMVALTASHDVYRPAEFTIGPDPALWARLDVAAFDEARQALVRLAAEDRRLMLCVPVHFDTLAKLAVRRDYIGALDGLGAAERRLLLFELLELPPGVLQTRLSDLVGPLRQRAWGVVARVGIEWRDFAPLRESGLRAVGIDVASHPGTDEALIRDALRFERAAHKAGLVAYLCGVGSLAVAQATRDHFAYLDGDAVAPLGAAPERIPALDLPPAADRHG